MPDCESSACFKMANRCKPTSWSKNRKVATLRISANAVRSSSMFPPPSDSADPSALCCSNRASGSSNSAERPWPFRLFKRDRRRGVTSAIPVLAGHSRATATAGQAIPLAKSSIAINGSMAQPGDGSRRHAPTSDGAHTVALYRPKPAPRHKMLGIGPTNRGEF